MELHNIVPEMRTFRYHFSFWDLKSVRKVYRLKGGIVAVGAENDSEIKMLWAVDDMHLLRSGLEFVAHDFPSVLFSYASTLSDTLEKQKLIASWGYSPVATYVCYRLNAIGQIEPAQPGISPLRLPDVEELHSFQCSIFNHLTLNKQDLVQWIESKDGVALGLKMDGRICGYVLLKRNDSREEEYFVREIAVAPLYRGRGFGKELLLAALRSAKQNGAKGSMLWVDYENLTARTLYENVGYQIDPDEAEAMFSTAATPSAVESTPAK